MATKSKPHNKLQTQFLSEMIKSLVQAVQDTKISENAMLEAMEHSQEIREEFKKVIVNYE